MRRTILIVLGVVGIVCGIAIARVPSMEGLRKLARTGSIQESAPIKASVEVTINASPEKVWGLLTNIRNWPTWQPDIASAESAEALADGSKFVWSTGGTEIHSQIASVQPVELLAWTGTAFQARAVHVWRLQKVTAGETRVKTDESMDGFLIGLFFSSAKLKENDQAWLDDLKAAAER